MTIPTKTREEWREDLWMMSCVKDKTIFRANLLRIIDDITRQAKVEALDRARVIAQENEKCSIPTGQIFIQFSSFNPEECCRAIVRATGKSISRALFAELTRLKEKV